MKAGYMLDMKPDGFGLVSLAYHATAVFSDPDTDALQLVLDVDEEPTGTYLPLPSTAPTPSGTMIYTFDSPDGDGNVVYRWRGKLNLLPGGQAFTYCQVRAEEFTNVVLRLYGGGDLLIEVPLTSDEVFTLPLSEDYNSFEIELIGTSRIYDVQVGDALEEFT